ncbi:MAG: hypothetical protein FWH29_00725 [Methanobrevibacter sp.]|nr:hypothetical protein [Methanobrevibacter sp.]
MKHTIDDLKKIWMKAGYKLSPYSKEDIEKAINTFGTLPDVLIEYYEKIGEIENQYTEHGMHIHAPTDLSIDTDNEKEFLWFSSEMQSVDIFAISLKDIDQKNPVVYCCGDSTYPASDSTDDMWISGTHPEMLDEELDLRTMMNFFWTIAYFTVSDKIEKEIKWKFEDDDS